uniref:Uncharacterized protein n=1 Tax=Lactuca sativa TaxID=4236 RepID=A0A9R1X3K2_LACSA|nr:hypothetical protein LSAT_V11C700383650 [Lactuca sativa]
MPKPLPLLELAQQKHKGITLPSHTCYVKLYKLSKSKEQLKLNLRFKSRMMETKLNTTDTFQVVKRSEKHTCSNTQLRPHHRHDNKNVLGHLFKIQTTLNDCLSVHISYWKTWSTKIYAFNLLRGTPEESFQRLHLYCYNLEKKNPGMVRAFQTSLHPITIINGAHLKGKYLGIEFLVVGMDGNNQIFFITFCFGKIKSRESWIWFFIKTQRIYWGPCHIFLSITLKFGKFCI